jgi:hypothetical protein
MDQCESNSIHRRAHAHTHALPVLTNEGKTFDSCRSNLDESLKVSVVETIRGRFDSSVALVRPGIGQHGIFVVDTS